MSHLWVRTDSVWSVFRLGAGRCLLTGEAAVPVEPVGGASEGGVVLLPVGDSAWLLLASRQSNVRINAVPLPLGLRLLSDRDEIQTAWGHHSFYSTEELAEAKSFPGAAQPAFCPRCRQEIERHSRAVRCPGCGIWHHATDSLPCWSYSETCALCSQTTALDAGFRWTPEAL